VSEPAPQSPAPSIPTRIWAIWACLAVAAAAAAYLLRSYMLSTYGVEAFESACNFGDAFNCDKINTSQSGKLFGIPVTVFAIPFYAAMAALAWLGSGRDGKSLAALRMLQVDAAFAVLYGAWLLYVMIAVEGTLCLFCLTMDAAAVAVLVLATQAIADLGQESHPPEWMSPLLTASVVCGAVFGSALFWYADSKDELVQQSIAHADAAAKATEAELAATAAPEPPPATPPPPPAAPAANQSGSQPGAIYTGLAKKLAGNKYVVPIHDDDAAIGPADAKVNIVQYADFQCPYCKKIFYALQNIGRRYKGQSVRIVFKHFPMNTLCNKHVKNNRHPYACNASLAAECARRQDLFWPMHDILFKNQHKLKTPDLRHYIKEVGGDLDRYVACMRTPEPRRVLSRHMDEAALGLGITATPRTFVNGTLYQGAISEELLDHAVQQELGKPTAATAPTPAPPAPATPRAAGGAQVRVKKAAGFFWIDAYESAIDSNGKALSLGSVMPANATWFEADQACRKAGKRLCTTEEWVSACQGKPAVDDDKDGNYANDYVEGNQFPYADYYEDRWCRVDEDRIKGRPGLTGGMAYCHTPDGIFDLTGNVEEWVGTSSDKALLAGGDFRVGDKGSCYRAHDSFGPGHKNHAIGFRCCSSKPVSNSKGKAVPASAPESMLGQKVPDFSIGDLKGGKISAVTFKAKVTFLTFFASWCTPCRAELPALAQLVKDKGAKGFQVVAIGVDTDEKAARDFVEPMALPYPVALDPQAKILGRFDVQNMPSAYLVGRDGLIVEKYVGYGTDTLKELVPKIDELLNK